MKLIITSLIIIVLTIWGIYHVKTVMEKNIEKYIEIIEKVK